MSAAASSLKIADALARKIAPDYRRHFGEIMRRQVKTGEPETYFSTIRASLNARIGEGLAITKKPVTFAGEQTPTSGKWWLVESIDGCDNFTHGREPVALIMLSMNGLRAEAGLIYFPLTDRVVTVAQGEGVSAEQRLRVAARAELPGSLVVTDTPIPVADTPIPVADAAVRISGCATADIVDLAAGTADVLYLKNPSPIHLVTALLVIREAGGYMSDDRAETLSQTSKSIVAGNQKIHGRFLKFLSVKH